ncbi:MAG: hypothetical protein AAF223_14940, partial [Bacteroidota bacterium]
PHRWSDFPSMKSRPGVGRKNLEEFEIAPATRRVHGGSLCSNRKFFLFSAEKIVLIHSLR